VADLTAEQFEQVPDFLKADYVQEGEVYRHASDLKVGKLKSSLDGLDQKLKEFEKGEHAKIEAAQAAALEKLKKEGKVDEILADADRRIGETTKQFNERFERMANQIKTEKRSALVSDLAAELATDKGSRAFKALVQSRIDVDAETGKVTFLNDDGSASSLDLNGFKAELMKDDSLSPLLKADLVTQGGGNANGNAGGSASVKTMKRSQFEALDPKSKMEFTRAGGKIN
jgi:hypothetical protein